MSQDENSMDIERDDAPKVNKQKLLEDLFGADSEEEQEEFKSEVPITSSNGNINNNNNNDDTNVDALFNDDGSLHSDEDEEPEAKLTTSTFTTNKKGAQRLTGEETQTTGVTHITSAPVPHMPENAKIHFVRIKPSIVGVQPSPYDPITYDGVDQQPELYVEEGFDKIRFKSESVIRWRWTPRGANDKSDTSLQTKQTNTRLVRWSDGSVHLFVGNMPFEVRDQQISDHRHMFVQQKGYIEMDQKLHSKFNFVPVAVAGKRKRAMLLDAKETKKRSSKLFTRLVNPEDFTQEQARKESLKKGGMKPPRRPSRGQEFNEDYLNDDSDNEGNVGAIKAQYRRVGDKDDEEAVERRILAAKETKARGAVLRNERKMEKDLAGFVVDDDEVSEGSFSDEDSDEDDYRRKKKQRR